MDKYLTLVNKEKHFDESMLENFEMVPFVDEDGETYVEKQTIEAFNKMAKYMSDTYDIELEIVSAGRSLERQQEVYEQIRSKHGSVYADAHVAAVGTSEHHTGLALDVHVHQKRPKFIQKLIKKSSFVKRYFDRQERESGKTDEMYHMLHNVMTDYGFILRYTEDKKPITGFDAERWHIRYVGEKYAERIKNSGLCLEEYVRQNTYNPDPQLPTFGE